jgi:type II secretory pathway predicted ATPase ExeA
MRWFNTAGPCDPEVHYTLPSAKRLPLVQRLIDQRGYFVIHAPRQTGKTTAMLTLAQQLTNSGQYCAILFSAEVGAAFPDDLSGAEQAILSRWQRAARYYLPPELQPPPWIPGSAGEQIGGFLQDWATVCPRPLVILIDEADALQDNVLISLLRQLRDGYNQRPQGFPHSLALIGLRDVRDYRMAAGSHLRTSSPFNIKVESLTLRNFSLTDVADLYGQHTAETGQIFCPEAVQRVYDLTQGQPWLVNACARQLVEEIAPDPQVMITVEMVDRAKEILIRRQDTHLDSLAERLREPRIQQIIEPILAGLELGNVPNDDIQFVLDLGLCVSDPQGGLAIANPIYREVLPRVLTITPEASLPRIAPTWLDADGSLNVQALLQAFLAFWRQHGEPLLNSAAYHEIAPHLVLMAFLHRVVNGGGTLNREYAIGSDRMDLCLRYGSVTLGIELKVWRDRRPDPLDRGLQQLESYLARLEVIEGWLVIFDRRSDALEIADRTQVEMLDSSAPYAITVIRA